MADAPGPSNTARYLVVVGQNSGIAQLTNVVVVDAESAKSARERACDLSNLVRSSASSCYAIEMDRLHDGWSYFT